MPIYYKGAAPGTHWNTHDACGSGFVPRGPGYSKSCDRMIQHVAHARTQSPYISLTRSYSVALHYALETGTSQPTATAPGYIYELEIDDTSGVTLIDPVKEIAADAPGPLVNPGYQHDGHQTVLLGVASSMLAFFLKNPIALPGGAGVGTRFASISPQIWGLVCSLRDSEILVDGNVPRNCVVNRESVY